MVVIWQSSSGPWMCYKLRYQLSKLDQDRSRIKMNQHGLIRIEIDQDGSTWIKMEQDGSLTDRCQAALVHVNFTMYSRIRRSACHESYQHPIPSPCHYLHQYFEFCDAKAFQVVLIYIRKTSVYYHVMQKEASSQHCWWQQQTPRSDCL